MRTDPNEACTNTREDFFWAFIHDAVSHPLMAFSGYSEWSLRFHNWTSHKAWPRSVPYVASGTVYWREKRVRFTSDGAFYSFEHPDFDHRVTVIAETLEEATEQMRKWFNALEEIR